MADGRRAGSRRGAGAAGREKKTSYGKILQSKDAEQIFIDSLAAGNPWTTARVAATNAEMR